jgi:hypothetical protein
VAQEEHDAHASTPADTTLEFRFPVLVSRVIAILAVGAAGLWLYAASEKFSSEYVFCPAACTDAPGWDGDTLLWLVPVVLVLLLAAPRVAARAVRGRPGSVAVFWTLCLVGWGVAAGIAFAVANDTQLLAPECEETVTAVDAHFDNEEIDEAARLIVANTGCFVQEDVDAAQQFLGE